MTATYAFKYILLGGLDVASVFGRIQDEAIFVGGTAVPPNIVQKNLSGVGSFRGGEGCFGSGERSDHL
jgi:hypothetical protein